MNIKSEEAHRLAKELSERTGETVTEAVTVALRERLARESELTTEQRAAKIVEIGRRTAPHMPKVSVEEMLYDERGLPREGPELHDEDGRAY